MQRATFLRLSIFIAATAYLSMPLLGFVYLRGAPAWSGTIQSILALLFIGFAWNTFGFGLVMLFLGWVWKKN